jgi:xanthine dehydrogenase accessory factor
LNKVRRTDRPRFRLLVSMRSLWPQLADWLDSGEPFALATVTAVSGSAPRVPGSCMAIMPDRDRFIGSVSSGCLDIEVVDAARVALRSGETQYLRFGPDGNPPWSDGLTCGGWVGVRVEPWWGHHRRAEVRAIAPVVRGWIERDEPGLVISSDACHLAVTADGSSVGDVGEFSANVVCAARDHVRGELPSGVKSDFAGPGLVSGPGSGICVVRAQGPGLPAMSCALFFRAIRRRPRLLIVGGVDVAVHLVALARESGFATSVIDPRAAFVAPERFTTCPDRLARTWPQEAVAALAPGPRDVALALTHDPKIDDVALLALLQTRAGYIGALGSRRSHGARLERLRAAGAENASLARIHGPAGLHLGTPDAAGIALGIMAGVARWQAEREASLVAAVSGEVKPSIATAH